MGTRRKGREVALQILYLADVSKVAPEKALRSVTKGEEEIDEKTMDFARALSFGTIENQARLDEVIKKYAQNWEIGRMAALDRNILRLGSYELLFETATPVSVIIDEAVEIAKTYSTADSGKFVNGILDKIKRERPSNGEEKNGKDEGRKSRD
jgi:N utilization substance protein B